MIFCSSFVDWNKQDSKIFSINLKMESTDSSLDPAEAMEIRCRRNLKRAWIIQTILRVLVFLSDLDHIQRDSGTVAINMEAYFPRFILALLPLIYSGSCFVLFVGFLIEILVFRWKQSNGRRPSIYSYLELAVWFIIPFLRLVTGGERFVSKEDLNTMWLIIDAVWNAVSVCFVFAYMFGVSFRNDEDRFEDSSVVSMVTKSTATTIDRHARIGGGQSRRRRRHGMNTSGRVQIASSDEELRSTTSKWDGHSIVSTPARFRAPSSIVSQVQPPSTSAASIVQLPSDNDDLLERMSTCRSSSSIVGSVYSTTRMEEDDVRSFISSAGTVTTGVRRRHAASTIMHYSASIASSVASAATARSVSNGFNSNEGEFKWKIVVGIVLVLSLSTNAVVLGYLFAG